MSSKKNSSSRSGRQESLKKNRRMRSMQLETLEPRQMLSAVAFTAENLIEDSMFQAVLGNKVNAEDTSERCVILNIASTDGKDFDVSTLKITDSSDKAVEVLSSKVENGVASILAKYKLGETYVFEVASEEGSVETPQYNVLFTMAGDISGDNKFTAEDYYTLFGEVNKGLGVNSRFIATYKNIYGVDITGDHYDAVYDVDGTGKISKNTFDTIIAPNYRDELVLTQEITTVPVIKNFQVNGSEPEAVPGNKYTYVTDESEDLILSGKTTAEEMLFTYTDADGKKYSGKLDLTKSGECTISTDATGADVIKLTYTLKDDGAFTLEFPDGSKCDGNITMELWSDAEHTMDSNVYTLFIDLEEPQMYADSVSVEGATLKEDVYYVKSKDFNVVVTPKAADGATLASLKAAMENEKDGIYLRVYDAEGEEITRKKLTADILSEGSDGKLVIKDVSAAVTQEEGAHTLTVAITDLAGNVYDKHILTVDVMVDVTGPVIAVDGYTPNMHYQDEKEFDAMLVKSDELKLTATATDTNTAAENAVTITCTQGGKTVEPTATASGKYEFNFKLASGVNTIVFTATDSAGNATAKTCLVYFSEKVELTDTGKELQKNGFTQNYSKTASDYKALDLYTLFNYDSGLTFTTASANKDLVTLAVSDKGVMSFTYKQTPEEGKTLTSEITVTAKNAAGDTCELKFTLNYVHSVAVEFWTETKVEKDVASESLADVEHIVSENAITFTGKLNVPDGSQGIFLNVYKGNETLHSAINLQKSSTAENFEYTYNAETGAFTLKLTKLADSLYTLRAYDVSGDENLVQDVNVYVLTGTPDVIPTIASAAGAVKKNPEFTLTSSGNPSELDAALGVWAQIYVQTSAEAAAGTIGTLYAQAKYDTASKKFGTLEYKLKDALADGSYVFTVQSVNAAGSVTKGNSVTVIVDSKAPVISVPDYVLNYHYNDKENYDSMLSENPELTFRVTAESAETAAGSEVTLTCTHNGKTVTAVKKENGTWTYDYELQGGINEIIFTAEDAAGNSVTKKCWVYCSAKVSLTPEGEKLQEDGFLQTYSADPEDYESIDLTKMFNYGNKLAFNVTCSDSSVATVSISEDGVLSFTYPTHPNAGETRTAKVTVKATDALENSCTLEFTLTYTRASEFMTNVKVENDYVENTLTTVKVQHILAQNEVKITGKLDVPPGASSLKLSVSRDGETVYSDVELISEPSVSGDLTYNYNAETGAFTLTLKDAADGIYLFETALPGQSEDTKQVISLLVDTVEPGVTGTISAPEYSNKNPELTLTKTGTLNELDATFGAWIEVYVTNASGTTAPYARTVFDYDSDSIGDFEYLISGSLPDGTYTLNVRTIDAAGNVHEAAGSSITVVIDRTSPEVTITGYTEDAELGYMPVSESALTLTASAADTNLTAFTCTQNGTAVTGTLNSDGSYTFAYTLAEGMNTIVFTATDRAGNQTVKTCKVMYENVPVVSEIGKNLTASGFIQAVTAKPEDNKTLDADTLFDSSSALTYKAESSRKDIVEVSVAADGILSFTYKDTPQGEEEFKSVITVTAENAAGKTCAMSFTLTYVADAQPPKWLNVTLENNVSESSLADVENILASDVIHFTGTLFDASDIVSAGMVIQRGGTAILEGINLLQNSGDGTAYTYTYNEADGTFSFTLSGVTSGEYTFCIFGKDEHGNESSMAAGNYQAVAVVVELEDPAVSAGMAVIPTGSSSSVVKGNPKFTLSAAGTPGTLDAEYGIWAQIYVEADGGDVLYAQAKYNYDEAAKIGAFGEIQYVYTGTLAEGVYNFRVQTVNVSGKTTETPGSSLEVTIDATAPVITANGYEKDYDSSDYGKYSRDGKNFDSMYLSNEYTEEDKYDLGISAEDETDVTFTVTVTSASGETETQDEKADISLKYGKNTIVVTAVDAAGNTSSETYVIYYNDTPSTTDYGAWLENNGFTQLVTSGTKKTLKLSDCLTDKKELHYSVENYNEEDGEISVSILNGTLRFTYIKTPTTEEEYTAADLCVTATDEFGETYEMSFVVKYSQDLYPPEWQDLELDGDPGRITSVMATKSDKISLSGILYDISEIKRAEVDVIFNEGKTDAAAVLENLNLLASSSGTAKNGLKYDYVYVKDANNEGGAFSLVLYAEDGTPVDAGLYTCYIAGEDASGNNSFDDEDTDEQVVNILVDRTAPALNAEMELIQTGTSTSKVNANPTFNLNFSTVSEAEAYGTWVEIYRVTTVTTVGMEGIPVTTETETLYASGIFKNGTCELKYSKTVLADGTYTFRVQTVDAAGNTNASAQRLSVTVDTVKPEFTLFSPLNTKIKDGGLYTNEKALFVSYTPSEPEVVMYYSTTGKAEDGKVYNSETGVPMSFGANALSFWLVDAAGNLGTPRTFTVTQDSIPVLVDGAEPLEDVNITFPEKSENTEFTVTLPAEKLQAMVTDADLAAGDKLTYSFKYTLPDGAANDLISMKVTESVTTAGVKNYILTFTVNDYDAARAMTLLGTVSFIAADTYGEVPLDETGALTFALQKSAIPVEVIATEISQMQNSSGSYDFDMNSVFRDPQGNAWKVTEYKVLVDGVQAAASEVSLSEDGKHILWTPKEGTATYGLYGDFVIQAAAANLDAEGNVISGTGTGVTNVSTHVLWNGYSVQHTAAGENITLAEGSEPFSSAYSEYFTVSNAFDSAKAWGEYTVTVSDFVLSVSASNQNVHGWSLDENGAREEHYSSLFSAAPAISPAGVITFALNTNAYGSASLNLTAGWTQNGAPASASGSVTVNVTNVPGIPHTVVKDDVFSIKTGTLNFNFLEECDAGPDDGGLAFTEWKITSVTEGFTASFTEAGDYLIIQDAAGNSYQFALASSESAPHVKELIRGKAYDKNNVEITNGSIWNNLDGIVLKTTYSVKNMTSEAVGSNSCDITFRGLALAGNYTGTRSSSAQNPDADILTAMNLDSRVWSITSMTGDDANVTWSDGKFHIAAGWYGTATFMCNIQNTAAEVTDSSTIKISVPNANLAPAWKEGVTLSADGKYVWNNTQSAEKTYTLDLRSLIADFDASVLTYSLVSSESGGITNVSAAGILTFTADEASFTTDGLDITVRAVSNSVPGSASADAQFTVKLVISEGAAAPEITDVIFASGENLLKLPEAGNYVFSVTDTTTAADAASGQKRFNAAVTDSSDELCETIVFLVKNSDVAGCTLTLSGEGLTPLLTGNGTLAYTLAANALSAQKITASAANSSGTDAESFDVLVSGSVLVEDASLNPYDYETVSGTLGKDILVSKKTSVNAEIASGSTLKSGTVLKSGSELSSAVFQTFGDDLEYDTDYTLKSNTSLIFVLLRDYTLKTDITTDAKCSISVSVLGGFSTLKSGSVLSGAVVNRISNISKVEKIYKDYFNSGTLLSSTIPASAFSALGVSVTGIQVPAISSDHAISSIVYREDGALTVTYKPYQVTQDRSPVEITLKLASGETMAFSVGMNYEKPFSLKYSLTSSKVQEKNISDIPPSVAEISAAPQDYYFCVWMQCELPTYSEEFLDSYVTYAFGSKVYAYVNKSAVSDISTIGGTASGSIEDFGDSWGIYIADMAVKEMSSSPVLLDGVYYRAGEYKITATGTAALQITTTQKLDFGFPFEEVDAEEGGTPKDPVYIGVTPAEIAANQMNIETTVTVPLEAAVMSEIAALSVLPESEIPVATELALAPVGAVEELVLTPVSAALPEAFSVVNTEEKTLLNVLPASENSGKNEDEDAEPETENGNRVAVESYFEGAASTLGCSTAMASNIRDTESVLRALEASPEIQKAAKALTDAAILESFGEKTGNPAKEDGSDE